MVRRLGLTRLAETISGWLLPLREAVAREAGWMRGWGGPSSDL